MKGELEKILSELNNISFALLDYLDRKDFIATCVEEARFDIEYAMDDIAQAIKTIESEEAK